MDIYLEGLYTQIISQAPLNNWSISKKPNYVSLLNLARIMCKNSTQTLSHKTEDLVHIYIS
jgi:hypothetical protein